MLNSCVWSPDYFVSSVGVSERLKSELNQLAEQAKIENF